MARKRKVLVTGGSGFLAKHIILQLLDEGIAVRATIRSPEREAEIVDAMFANARDPNAVSDLLEFAHVDLLEDAGWADAAKGVSAIIHTASPFPMSQPDDEDVLVGPAVEGTRRVLKSALGAGVARVILTSSIAAMVHKRLAAGRNRYDDTDWSEVSSAQASPYVKSKTLAEKAAWSFAREHSDIKLTVINPGFILGPALDARIGTSLKVIARLMKGGDPAVPRLGFPVVDVRDVALMHVRALQNPDSIGGRFIGAERFMWMIDIVRVLTSEYPDRRIPKREAPDWVIKLMSIFDKTLKAIVPSLGHETPVDNTPACEVLGMEFIESRQAIRTSAASLLRDDLLS